MTLGRAVLYVGEVGQWNMANVVMPTSPGGVAADIADRGQAFGISLPGLPGGGDFPYHIVPRDGEAGRRLPVVVGQDLSGREHEVVADGGVGVA